MLYFVFSFNSFNLYLCLLDEHGVGVDHSPPVFSLKPECSCEVKTNNENIKITIETEYIDPKEVNTKKGKGVMPSWRIIISINIA